MRSLASSVILVALVPVLAHAVENPGINFAWNNCLGVGDAASNINYACDGSRNGQPYRAVFSFVQPVPIDSFVGVQGTLDFTAGTPTLPDWWTLAVSGAGPPGPDCRDGNFDYPASFLGVGDASCMNPWVNAHTGGGWAFWYQNKADNPWTPTPWPGYGRIRFAFARDTTTHLDGGGHYIGGVFTIDTWKDVDTGEAVCSGCSLPACLAMTELSIYQVSGSPPQDIFTFNAPATRQYITWQGGNVGGNGCPGAVPVRRATWGSIKATYR